MDLEYRHYTVTIKPTAKQLKGQTIFLKEIFTQFLDVVGGECEELTYEMMGTPNLHLHALVKCPYIKSKYHISKLMVGYHLHTKLIRQDSSEIEVKTTWNKYIRKERSDADLYTEVFGNMFPLEDLY